MVQSSACDLQHVMSCVWTTVKRARAESPKVRTTPRNSRRQRHRLNLLAHDSITLHTTTITARKSRFCARKSPGHPTFPAFSGAPIHLLVDMLHFRADQLRNSPVECVFSNLFSNGRLCFCVRSAPSGFTLSAASVLSVYRESHGGRQMPGEQSFLFGQSREEEISRFDRTTLFRLTFSPPRVVILRRCLQSDGDATGELVYFRKCPSRTYLLNSSLLIFVFQASKSSPLCLRHNICLPCNQRAACLCTRLPAACTTSTLRHSERSVVLSALRAVGCCTCTSRA